MRAVPLSADQAFIALIIAAMEANDHAAPEEAARAERLVRSLSRFRRRRRPSVGRLIAEMKSYCAATAPAAVVDAACRAIPPRARTAAFAAVADLLAVDGRLDRSEHRFLRDVAEQLGLRGGSTRLAP